jgi:broad specificity phosphatase PhoE
MNGSCLVYLIRSGSTLEEEQSAPLLLGRDNDPRLSQAGKVQAAQLSRNLRKRGPTAVYSSSHSRAVETAQLLARHAGVGILMRHALDDADTGLWAGRSWEDIREHDGPTLQMFLRDPEMFGYPAGETLLDIQKRVIPFLNNLAQEHDMGRVAVVTHDQVIGVVLTTLQGLPLTRVREIVQEPGCVNVLRCYRDQWEIHSVNFNMDRRRQPARASTL